MNAKIKKLWPQEQVSGSIDYETKLWADIRNDEKQALAKLFCKYYEYLYNYGYKIVPGEEFIKDCIQDLFLTIWKSRKTINSADSVKSYLFISMRRTIFRKLRKQKARKIRNKKYLDVSFEDLFNMEDLMIHLETQNEHKKKLIVAIDSLGKKQKEAIYLKFYEGFSSNEIAAIMGIKRQSVYNHISEGVQKLKEFIV